MDQAASANPSGACAPDHSICSFGFWCWWRWRSAWRLACVIPDVGARMEPLGNAFIKAIRVLIAPIIFCTVVHGIASMANMAKVGRVALKALIYFEVLTTIALIVGLVAVNLFQPGAGMHVDLSHVDTSSVAHYLEQTQRRTTAQFLLNIIPNTFIGAFSEGNVLQVLLRLGAVRLRVELDGPRRQAAHRSDRNGGADVLSHRRHRHVGGADRRVRRHCLHCRQVRRRLAVVAGQAAGRVSISPVWSSSSPCCGRSRIGAASAL